MKEINKGFHLQSIIANAVLCTVNCWPYDTSSKSVIDGQKNYLCASKLKKYIFDSLNHRRIFGSVPSGSHPLVHHDACMSVDQEPQEEQYDGRDDHHSQRVQFVVLMKARAVEVKAGVELDADQGQDDTDPVGDGLGVGLEVLQD